MRESRLCAFHVHVLAAVAMCVLGTGVSRAGAEPEFAASTISTFGSARPAAWVVADMNGDNHLDVVYAADTLVQTPMGMLFPIYMLLNDGQSPPSFTELRVDGSLIKPSAMLAADITGNGLTDLVVGWPSGIGFLQLHRNVGTEPDGRPIWEFNEIAFGVGEVRAICAGDINDNGLIDLAITCGTDSLRWYRRLPQSPPQFAEQLVPTSVPGASSIAYGDMDGDGDGDLVVLSQGHLRVYEFMPQSPPPGYTAHTVATESFGNGTVFVADLDRDGLPDIVAASDSDSMIRWYRNEGGAPFTFTEHIIATETTATRRIFVADVNGDDRPDVVAASPLGGWVRWYENTDTGPFTPPEFVARDVAGVEPTALAVIVVDLDRDDDADIVAIAVGDVKLYDSGLISGTLAVPERQVRNLTTGVLYPAPHMLGQAIAEASDGDALEAHSDVFSVPMTDVNLGAGPGSPSLSLTAVGNVLSQTPMGSVVLENDLFAATQATILGPTRFVEMGAVSLPIGRAILRRDEGRMLFGTSVSLGHLSHLQAATTISFFPPEELQLASGAQVELTAPGGVMVYGIFSPAPDSTFQVPAGPLVLGSTPAFFPEVVSSVVSFATSVVCADINRDGYPDILSTSQSSNSVFWHESDRASPPSFTTHLITDLAGGARSVGAADFDGDGDLDVLAVAEFDDAIRWYRNNGESPASFSGRTVFAAPGSIPQHAVAADLDGDGDVDVVSAGLGGGMIRWHENDGAFLPTFTAHEIFSGPAGATAVFVADLDGDDDLDVLSVHETEGVVRWHENDGGSPPAFTTWVIPSSVPSPRTVSAADLDGDGHADVLVGGFDGSVRWYAGDGQNPPAFTEHVVSSGTDGAASVLARDVDGDGRMDIVLLSFDRASWLWNNGDSPPLFLPRTIADLPNLGTGLALADLDRDGHLDVVTASYVDHTVAAHMAAPQESTHLNAGSSVSAAGPILLARPVSMIGSSIASDGEVRNASRLTATGFLSADLVNDGELVIPDGTLFVTRTLANGGVIRGGFDESFSGGLSVQHGLSAAPDSCLLFPFGGSNFCGGDFDCAIDHQGNFDLAAATLRLNRQPLDGPQSFEVMSRDIGPDPIGLDRSHAGHFPLDALHIGPGATTVNLVDNHDNARDGQAACEALYVRELLVYPAATLNTGTCRVYYESLILDGSVDNPANLIQIAPPCPADFDANGEVQVSDIFTFLAAWFAGEPAAYEFGGTPGVPAIFAFLAAWFAGCG